MYHVILWLDEAGCGLDIVMTTDAPTHQTTLLSEADAVRLADVMRALASPVRLRILGLLRTRPTTVTEVSELLGTGQTTISNHLRLLRHLSLVTANRDGRHMYYTLFDQHVVELLDEAIGHLDHVPRVVVRDDPADDS